MELKIIEFQQPKDVLFNFNELKTEVEAKTKQYETLVYTDDQIKDAKTDRANLNKLKKALNDERIRLQKEYFEPFNKFKAQIDEIISIIDRPVQLIDKQIKEAEEMKKREKREAIQKFWDETEIALPIPLKLEQIFNQSWLNASVSMKSIQTEIKETLAKIEQDLVTLENLPEFSFEAKEVYKSTLDLSKAISEGQRLADIQKRKQEQEAEQERLKAEAEAKKQDATVVPTVNIDNQVVPVAEIPVEVPKRQWISFKANLTVEEAHQLKNFFDCRGIEFKAI